LTLPKIMSAASAARRASSSSCTRPERAKLRGIEALHAEREAVDAGREESRELLPLEGAGIGFERDLRARHDGQPRADAAEQAVDRVGGEDARRSAADEHADDLAAPYERQRALEVLQQRVDVLRLGNVAACLVRVEVAVRALAHAPRDVHVQRQRRQDVNFGFPGSATFIEPSRS
jgi:hypothetical protein